MVTSLLRFSNYVLTIHSGPPPKPSFGAVPEYHLPSFPLASSPGVQLCVPEWLWSAIIWLFALQPFWNKAKEVKFSWEGVSHWCLQGTPAWRFFFFLVRSWARKRDLTVQKHWCWNPRTLLWHTLKWESALRERRRDWAPTDEFVTNGNETSMNTNSPHWTLRQKWSPVSLV